MKKAFTLIELLVVIAILAILAGFILPMIFGGNGCSLFIGYSDDSIAINALEANGYRDVTVVEKTNWWLYKREEERTRFTCTAINSQGQNVTVYVYSGPTGSTVRVP